MASTIIDHIEQLKYKDEIRHLDINYGEGLHTQVFDIENLKAFRFVFKDKPEKNHLPVYINSPKRTLGGTNRKVCIEGYALSCLETLEAAENYFNYLINSAPNIPKSIGNSIAEGILTTLDGVVENPDTHKHFELFEYENCNLSSKFVTIKEMI